MRDHRETHLRSTSLYTGFALVAFAANSLLCRIALGEEMIDAASFTTVRLGSGAVALLLISRRFHKSNTSDARRGWGSAAMLFLYAAAFSFAYVTLNTGTGALILFGAVQMTMILTDLRSGERLHAREWIGASIAFAGLVYLVSPGLAAPSLGGSVLMAIAGIAWGVYSLRGRGATNPLVDTTHSFVRSLPFVLALALLSLQYSRLSSVGVLLAISSGALASGVGYTVWYAALGELRTSHAAVVQLLVPVLAASGGVIILSEEVSFRLLLSSLMILGGVGVVVVEHPSSP